MRRSVTLYELTDGCEVRAKWRVRIFLMEVNTVASTESRLLLVVTVYNQGYKPYSVQENTKERIRWRHTYRMHRTVFETSFVRKKDGYDVFGQASHVKGANALGITNAELGVNGVEHRAITFESWTTSSLACKVLEMLILRSLCPRLHTSMYLQKHSVPAQRPETTKAGRGMKCTVEVMMQRSKGVKRL